MDAKFIEKMKQKLLDSRNAILLTLAQKSNDFSEITSAENLTDYADIASSFTDQQMIESIGQQEVNRLKLIESALLRIEQGKYGKCIKCKKDISMDRLKAIPYALKCIECQELDEKKKTLN